MSAKERSIRFAIACVLAWYAIHNFKPVVVEPGAVELHWNESPKPVLPDPAEMRRLLR